jgi:charged multivesicular body protein 4
VSLSPSFLHATPLTEMVAAKAALRRKKQFEHSLEQTSAQITTLEREIYSIETANINKETLDAMQKASTAMKQIHGGLTIDKVDNVMYVSAWNLLHIQD